MTLVRLEILLWIPITETWYRYVTLLYIFCIHGDFIITWSLQYPSLFFPVSSSKKLLSSSESEEEEESFEI